MKRSKFLLALSSFLLASTLAACGGGTNHNPGAVTQDPTPTPTQGGTPTPEPTVVPTPTPSTSPEIDVTLDELNVFLYEKFVDENCSNSLKSAFESYLVAQKIEITTLNWVLDETGDVTAVTTAVEKYDTDHPDAKVDVILGAKGNLKTYITENFTALKKDDTNYYEMTTTAGEKTHEDRRVYVANDTNNFEAVKLLVKHLVDYDLPDPEATPTPTPEVTPTPEPTVVPTPTPTPTASEEPVVLDQLVVYMFSASIDTDNNTFWKNKFNAYLAANDITITNLVWEFSTATKVAALDTEVSKYDEDHPTATVDVLLGGKAYAAESCAYISENFASMKDAGGSFYEITTIKDGTETSQRRFWQRKDSTNKVAVQHLVDALVAEAE